MKPKPQISLILAGGYGRRAKTECPKQFVKVQGHSVLAYTAAAFQRHPGIDGFYVVCAEEWSDAVSREMKELGFGKFSGTFLSGATSIDSLRNGVEGLIAEGVPEDTVVVVHEAVRPLVSQAVISESLAVCNARGNALAGVESYESYLQSPTGVEANGMQSRYGLFRAQTPQTFSLGRLQRAFVMAARRGIHTSQSLFTFMAELGAYPLYISQGEHSNIKLTLPEDLRLFEALVKGGYLKLP